MSVREEPRIGTELAGYRIEVLLGRGGMAAVYRAEDLRLGRPVAVKLLSPELAEDESFRERFLRESRLAASLDHAHVIPIYEAGEADGRLFIAMRYVEGTDLATMLAREGALRPSRALALLGPVAGALDAAHARGLVHRDVKPGNILIAVDRQAEPPEHVYLSDFGLTKQAASESGLTQTGQLVGTPDYVAPEQLGGAPLDGRADLYSLGCLVFECLTGAPPFQRDSLMAVLWGHVNDPPPRASERRPELPRAIDAVLAKAMAKRPEERYPTCRAFVTAVREALGVEPISPPPVRLGRTIRGPRLVVAAIAVVGALTALVLALALRGSGDERRSSPGRVGATDAAGPANVVRQSVAVIDPGTTRVVDAIEIGGIVGPITVGGGWVWVGNVGENTLLRIHPATRRVVERIGLGFTPDWLAFAAGGLWILDMGCDRPCGTAELRQPEPVSLTRFDPGTREMADPIELGPGGLLRTPITAVDDAIWVANSLNDTLYRIDPTSGRVVATVEVSDPGAIAIGSKAVWVIADGSATVERIDPSTGSLVETIRVGNDPEGIAVSEDVVWVSNFGPDSAVWRVDADFNRVRGIVPVGGSPTAVAAGERAVWVNHFGGDVSRIDTRTNEVASIDLGRPGYVLALGEGYVWVTVR